MNIILLLLLLLEGFLMLVISFVGIASIYFMLNSKFMRNSPPVPSSGKVKVAMIDDVAQILKKKSDQLVMDLGSGWGTLLLPLAKKFPNHHFIGIEYGCIPYWVSKFRSRKMKNITFYRQDFLNSDVSKADIIFLFLLTKTMAKIKVKCQTETKEGALLYANRFSMPGMKPKREISLGSKYNTYYVYEIHKARSKKKK